MTVAAKSIPAETPNFRVLRRQLAAVVVIALAAWPFTTIVPGVGGNWGWVAGLAIATHEGFRFGEQLIWTYGPLWFLDAGPVLYFGGGITDLAFAYQWILQLLLAGTMLLAIRRSYPATIAFLLAFVVIALLPERATALGFAWCVMALTRNCGGDDIADRWFPAAIGVLAGISLLGKLNHGAELLVLAPIALLARPEPRRLRDAASFALALALTVLAGWIATGQAAANAWDYIQYSIEVVAGYDAAMGMGPESGWSYVLALGVFLLVSTLVWDVARRTAGRSRWGLVACWLVFAYFSFKTGFVRADAHKAIFAGNLLVVVAVLPVRGSKRPLALASFAACVAAFALWSSYPQIDRLLNPILNARAAIEQTRTLVSDVPATRANLVAETRAYYRLPFTRELSGHSVTFWHYGNGDVAYGYPLDWQPLPVLEAYGAYTRPLDEVNARMLSSEQAPQRIMRALQPPIDGRLAAFEAPATTRAILCRYREAARRGGWQLLAQDGDRCGRAGEIDTVDAGWNEQVVVPRPRRPNSAVLVRIDGADPSGLERLEELWLRPAPRYAYLDGRAYRLVAATAPDGLLLTLPEGFDYPPPFALAPDPRTIAIGRGDSPGGELRYSFVEIPLDEPAVVGDVHR